MKKQNMLLSQGFHIYIIMRSKNQSVCCTDINSLLTWCWKEPMGIVFHFYLWGQTLMTGVSPNSNNHSWITIESEHVIESFNLEYISLTNLTTCHFKIIPNLHFSNLNIRFTISSSIEIKLILINSYLIFVFCLKDFRHVSWTKFAWKCKLSKSKFWLRRKNFSLRFIVYNWRILLSISCFTHW